MDTVVKQEIFETGEVPAESRQRDVSVSVSKPALVIDLSSSDSDSYDSDDSTVGSFGKRYRASNGVGEGSKKQKFGIELPLGFLDPLPPEDEALQLPGPSLLQSQSRELVQSCKQFWKAGDYEGGHEGGSGSSQGGMDHLRVHPKFLHSNATSHKWALGAFAELLDNSLDEFCNGATYVNVDMLKNMKDGSRMLLVEDNGGGMDPDKMRLCMSLGYSVKSKLTNTIGQYGNGFKTSTMRLGADVIVFSRCHGKDGKSQTQSIGMLSYTFLRSTGKEDIVVPLLDYEKGRDWTKMIRSSPDDWNRNLEAIVQWSPYSSEADLLNQFNLMKDQGTRIIIYNLWENDEGELELDFDTDPHDIQMRGVNRDEMKIEMAKQFPSSKHFLTYRHSLRSYASILYLRRPPGFKIILRGKDVEHHNIVNDMMLPLEVTYRPQLLDGVLKDSDMMAVVKIGFVKDAKGHIDIQGFNVYHKNRLIRPFWRVWNASGSGGRGVIGVLEANFVEPAHDKQGFERTTVLARLEARLKEMQKEYWFNYCHEVGYVSHRNKKLANESAARETSPDYLPRSSSRHTQSRETPNPDSNKSHSNQKIFGRKEPERSFKAVDPKLVNGDVYRKGEKGTNTSTKYGKKSSSSETSAEDGSDHEMQIAPVERVVRGSSIMESSAQKSSSKDGNNHENDQVHTYSRQMQIAPVERVVHGTSIMASPAQKSSSKDGNNHENERVHTSSRQMQIAPVEKVINGSSIMASPAQKSSSKDGFLSDNHEKEQVHTSSRQMDRISTRSQSKAGDATFNGDGHATSTFNACSLNLLSEENCTLKARLREMERDLQFERDRCKSLDAQVKNAEQKLEAANKEQEALIDIFSEERCRRDNEEDNLRKKLKDDSKVIQELLDRVVSLENMRCNCKTEMLTA